MKQILVTILSFFFISFSAEASVRGDVNKGNSLFKKGSYAESIEKYNKALKKDPNSEIVNYNLGSAQYKNGNLEDALMFYQQALLGKDKMVRENAHYNLGNTYYYYGLGLEKDNIDKAIEAVEKSLANYEKALGINIKDEDAKANHDFVKKELERLKKKQEEQKQQNKQQNSQEQDKEQKDQSPDQEKSEQEGSKENSDEQKAAQTQPDQQNSRNQEGGNKSQDANKKQGASFKGEMKEMTKEQAQALLENYQQDEEPKKILMFNRNIRSREVEKDW
ncbi:MAG: tetratricopeptide repeat protein [Candidatus Omnitrophica bacterium]|nr:tetratricopeptide repeat protein [Candidatus Omnitrophota bacterium]